MEPRILILDDDLQVRDSLAMFLEDEDYTVSIAESAERAVEAISCDSFDLAIVDLRLPGMSGAEFINEAAPMVPGMKFIIYTGSPSNQVSQHLLAKPYVSETVFMKPLLDFAPLCNEIERMLNLPK